MTTGQHIRVLEGCRPDALPLEELLAGDAPAVLKGVVTHWPLVQAGLRSAPEAMNYLRSFYNGKTVGASHGDPNIAGVYTVSEFRYTADASGGPSVDLDPTGIVTNCRPPAS